MPAKEKKVRQIRLGEFQTLVKTVTRGASLVCSDAVDGIIVTDENTRGFAEDSPLLVVQLESGERHKNWASVQRILEEALGAGLGRDSVILGCGGGVLCDMAAFAASVYMRGCRLFLVPTTLLAMVDASIGGKTGIDFLGTKNTVGTFYPAEEVRIHLGYLESLPEREFRPGMAEVIKHGLLGDATLHRILSERISAVLGRDPETLTEIVDRAINVKLPIVEADLRESGSRAHLNLGHTFAHALEAATGFAEWTHGEAVAWGIGKAMSMGVMLGVTDSAYAREVRELMSAYEYRLEAPGVPTDALIAAMMSDKKKRRGTPRFVLQRTLGQTTVQEVDLQTVRQALESG